MSLWQKIKLLFSLNSSIKEVQTVQIKNGFFSSEFITALLTKMTAIACAIKGVAPWDLCLIATVVSDCTYMFVRSWIKIKSIVKPNVPAPTPTPELPPAASVGPAPSV